MDVYIAEKFCTSKDQINELASLVLTPRIQWREKLEIFKVLILKYNKEFKEDYPTFHTNIKDVIEHRNVLAHLSASVTTDSLNEYNTAGNITFHKFKNFTDGKTNEIGYSRTPFYTNESLDNIIYTCNLYVTAIKKILIIAVK